MTQLIATNSITAIVGLGTTRQFSTAASRLVSPRCALGKYSITRQSPIEVEVTTTYDFDCEKHKDDLVKNESTIMLLNQIIEVDGNRDREFVKEFIQTMRILDAKSLRKYMGEIESGIDMNITIGTPGGGSINTFLPLTTKFFWPDL